MTLRKHSTLYRIDNLKKCADEKVHKWQKCNDMVPQPGKENQTVVRDFMFLHFYTTHKFLVVSQDTAGLSFGKRQKFGTFVMHGGDVIQIPVSRTWSKNQQHMHRGKSTSRTSLS